MIHPHPVQPIKLYGFTLSGHSHRAELFLSLLGLPVERIEVDLANAAHKHPDFLRLNGFGLVPVIDDGGVVVADSNAILVYLARKYGAVGWLPTDPVGAAQVERWLAVAAGLVAFGPAAARLITVFGSAFNADEVQSRAHRLLQVVDSELQSRLFLTGAQPTIADIANYTFIAHAPEGGVSLQDYPQVRAWLARIEQLPGFVPMPKSPVGCAA
jgi:glutathione S-transferase